MKILGDQPIKQKSEDALDRSGFAEHIADGILKWKSEENLCVALHGPWGSGKTSIINLCLDAIKEKVKNLSQEEQPIIIQFQPWIISGQEQLISTFLTQLRKTLKKPNLSKHAQEAAKHLETYERLFSLASWIPPISGYAEKIKNALSRLKGTAEAASKQLEQDLDQNKKSICDALAKLKSPVIITIDDVDRLTSEEIRQLFQLIKAVADFPKTIYILAFDYSLVEKALEPFQSGSDTRYLEKIIQLDFEIPYPSRSAIATVLWNGLDDIIKTIPTEKYEQARWNEIKFGPLSALFRNIRDVKRYLNAVNFMFPIINGEVTPVDLLIVEAIHVFAPSLYKTIRDNKDSLISGSYRAKARSENDERQEWIKNLPNLVPVYCRDAMKQMLSHLFPEIESVFERHGWGDSFVGIWDKNQRICISPYFDYYFQGSTPEGEISARETQRTISLINDQNNLSLLLKNYVIDGRIKKLIAKIENYFKDNIDAKAIQNFIISIFEAGESLPLRPDGMLEMPLDWAISGVIYRLLRLLDSDKRKEVLINAINLSKNAIFFPVSVTSYIWEEWNPRDGKESKKTDEEKLLNNKDADEVKDAALTLLKKNKDTEILYKAPHLLSILYDWERWSGIKEVKEWTETIISDDKKIPEFLGGCGGFIGRAGMDSHFARYKFKVEPKNLERFCDVEQLKKKSEQLLASKPEWLTDIHKEIINAFLNGFLKKDPWDDD